MAIYLIKGNFMLHRNFEKNRKAGIRKFSQGEGARVDKSSRKLGKRIDRNMKKKAFGKLCKMLEGGEITREQFVSNCITSGLKENLEASLNYSPLLKK